MLPVEAIAWDVDGTLVDSEPLHHRALVAASRRWGADLSDLDDHAFVGVHMHDVWTALAGRFPAELERECWLAAVDDHYVEGAAALQALAGAAEAIRGFAERGLAQVCVSNSNRRIVDANLEALGIRRDIAFSISFDDVGRGKPDPEPYRLACERLGLESGRVLAVEDSQTGLESARAAGLRTAGYGPHLADGRADVTIARLEDLVPWFDAARAGRGEGGR